jgi:hypothetical protein
MAEPLNQPVKKFRAGQISASIWRNERQEDGRTVVSHSVSIQKRYRDRNGEWQTGDYYWRSELPALELVVRKAHEHLALTAVQESEAVTL